MTFCYLSLFQTIFPYTDRRKQLITELAFDSGDAGIKY